MPDQSESSNRVEPADASAPSPRHRPSGTDLLAVALVVFFVSLVLTVGALMILPAIF